MNSPGLRPSATGDKRVYPKRSKKPIIASTHSRRPRSAANARRGLSFGSGAHSGGVDDDGLPIKSQKWTKVYRNPTAPLDEPYFGSSPIAPFQIPMWVRIDELTEEERKKYDAEEKKKEDQRAAWKEELDRRKKEEEAAEAEQSKEEGEREIDNAQDTEMAIEEKQPTHANEEEGEVDAAKTGSGDIQKEAVRPEQGNASEDQRAALKEEMDRRKKEEEAAEAEQSKEEGGREIDDVQGTGMTIEEKQPTHANEEEGEVDAAKTDSGDLQKDAVRPEQGNASEGGNDDKSDVNDVQDEKGNAIETKETSNQAEIQPNDAEVNTIVPNTMVGSGENTPIDNQFEETQSNPHDENVHAEPNDPLEGNDTTVLSTQQLTQQLTHVQHGELVANEIQCRDGSGGEEATVSQPPRKKLKMRLEQEKRDQEQLQEQEGTSMPSDTNITDVQDENLHPNDNGMSEDQIEQFVGVSVECSDAVPDNSES